MVATVEVDLSKVEGGGITKLVIVAGTDLVEVEVELVVDRNLLEGTSEVKARELVGTIGRGLVVPPSFSFGLPEVLKKFLATRIPPQ